MTNIHVPLKPYHKDFSYSYTLGVFPTLELLQHQPERILKVLLHSKGASNEGVALIRELCAERGIWTEEQDKAVDKLGSRGDTYAVGVFAKFETPLDGASSHVVLVNPSDMGNLGTIMRTLLGFGQHDLAILPPAADAFDPRVVRASMGALFSIRQQTFPTFDAYRARFADRRLYPFMTDSATLLPEVTFEPPYTLIFGNESAGLDPAYNQIGTPVAIPQTDAVDSLNLAISVGIALYASSREKPF